MKVLKYPTTAEPGDFTLFLPVGAEVLSFAYQPRQGPMLWCRVDELAPSEERNFVLAGTGHPLDPGMNLRFVGTVLMHEGALVVHLFEVVKFPPTTPPFKEAPTSSRKKGSQ